MYIYKNSKDLINTLLLKKLLKSGKQTKALKVSKYLNILSVNNNIFKKAILNLIVPIKFKEKKIGSITYKIPYLIHYYKSIKLAITWFIQAATLRSINKIPMYKALYLESLDILKNQGYAYSLKQSHIKKALISRVFIYLISSKKSTK